MGPTPSAWWVILGLPESEDPELMDVFGGQRIGTGVVAFGQGRQAGHIVLPSSRMGVGHGILKASMDETEVGPGA